MFVLAAALAGSALTHRTTPNSALGDVDAEAVAWDARAGAVFAPVAKQLPNVAHHVEQWRRGELAASQVDAELGILRTGYLEAARQLADIPRLPATEAVLPFYRSSLELGAPWVDITRAAMHTPRGATADQLYLSGRRLRELADRVFDRGHVLLAPLIGTKPTPGVEFVPPPALPDWFAEGLAAGPPIDDPPPASFEPHARQGPALRRDVWITRFLASLGAPRPADVAAAASRGDAGALRQLADRLDTATEEMFSVPMELERTPAGQDTRVIVGLRFLIDAEAARLFLLGRPEIATAVLHAGAPVWVSDLPAR